MPIDKIVLPKELQKQMLLFFSRTSIPRKKRVADLLPNENNKRKEAKK